MNDKDFYQKEGYLLCRNLIPDNVIDKTVKEYKKSLADSERHFFRQNLNYWTKNKKNKHGYVINSFLDPHDYGFYPEFRDAVRNVLMNSNVRGKLEDMTGEKGISLMQSMFFDLNTATWPHADNYYLDSIPNGHLLGGWFALEDIPEKAGRFYVIKNTNKEIVKLNELEEISDEMHRNKIRKYLRENHPDKKGHFAPEMKKGDVLFWNSRVLHGSYPTEDESLSRRSLTAHFMPSKCKFGNLTGEFPQQPDYGEYNGFKYRLDTKTYSASANFKIKMFRSLNNYFPRLVSLKRKIKS